MNCVSLWELFNRGGEIDDVKGRLCVEVKFLRIEMRVE